MAKPITHKPATTPKASEPHTIEVENLEAYTELTAHEPYTYLQRILPQYVINLMLKQVHQKGKRLVRLYLPIEIFAEAYRKNPPLFAKIVRSQRDAPFQYVTARFESQADRMKITASDNAPQKQGSYLGSCAGTMLGLQQKQIDQQKPGGGFSVVFPFADMPRSYQNDPNLFRFRVQKILRHQLNLSTLMLTLQHIENGYRLNKVPATENN